MIEIISIDLSNYCSKQCPFCYNHSNKEGNTIWQPKEVIDFAIDCIENGVKAISLGGGEPFEYDGVFEIIKALYPKCYLSITTNGLPLEKAETWDKLLKHQPDKIHITIHQPQDENEIKRVENLIVKLSKTNIKPGVNLLIGADKLNEAKQVYARISRVLNPSQIILVPQRYSNQPTPKDLSFVTNEKPFQAPSCILECKPPKDFVSISWDKKVNFCSYALEKQELKALNYQGLIASLNAVNWTPCC